MLYGSLVLKRCWELFSGFHFDRKTLETVFDEVIVVDVLDSGDSAHLTLMKRPALGVTLIKLHCWTRTQYSKCVFMDADTLFLANIDDLFEREELAPAPDPGWPDCFNSGVFVYQPSVETYNQLLRLASEQGSFDGTYPLSPYRISCEQLPGLLFSGSCCVPLCLQGSDTCDVTSVLGCVVLGNSMCVRACIFFP